MDLENNGNGLFQQSNWRGAPEAGRQSAASEIPMPHPEQLQQQQLQQLQQPQQQQQHMQQFQTKFRVNPNTSQYSAHSTPSLSTAVPYQQYPQRENSPNVKFPPYPPQQVYPPPNTYTFYHDAGQLRPPQGSYPYGFGAQYNVPSVSPTIPEQARFGQTALKNKNYNTINNLPLDAAVKSHTASSSDSPAVTSNFGKYANMKPAIYNLEDNKFLERLLDERGAMVAQKRKQEQELSKLETKSVSSPKKKETVALVVSPTDTKSSANSPKASLPITLKPSPKSSPKSSPKVSLVSSPKSSPKSSPNDSIKDSLANAPNASPKSSPKGSPIISSANVPKASPEESPISSVTIPNASPEGEDNSKVETAKAYESTKEHEIKQVVESQNTEMAVIPVIVKNNRNGDVESKKRKNGFLNDNVIIIDVDDDSDSDYSGVYARKTNNSYKTLVKKAFPIVSPIKSASPPKEIITRVNYPPNKRRINETNDETRKKTKRSQSPSDSDGYSPESDLYPASVHEIENATGGQSEYDDEDGILPKKHRSIKILDEDDSMDITSPTEEVGGSQGKEEENIASKMDIDSNVNRISSSQHSTLSILPMSPSSDGSAFKSESTNPTPPASSLTSTSLSSVNGNDTTKQVVLSEEQARAELNKRLDSLNLKRGSPAFLKDIDSASDELNILSKSNTVIQTLPSNGLVHIPDRLSENVSNDDLQKALSMVFKTIESNGDYEPMLKQMVIDQFSKYKSNLQLLSEKFSNILLSFPKKYYDISPSPRHVALACMLECSSRENAEYNTNIWRSAGTHKGLYIRLVNWCVADANGKMFENLVLDMKVWRDSKLTREHFASLFPKFGKILTKIRKQENVPEDLNAVCQQCFEMYIQKQEGKPLRNNSLSPDSSPDISKAIVSKDISSKKSAKAIKDSAAIPVIQQSAIFGASKKQPSSTPVGPKPKFKSKLHIAPSYSGSNNKNEIKYPPVSEESAKVPAKKMKFSSLLQSYKKSPNNGDAGANGGSVPIGIPRAGSSILESLKYVGSESVIEGSILRKRSDGETIRPRRSVVIPRKKCVSFNDNHSIREFASEGDLISGNVFREDEGLTMRGTDSLSKEIIPETVFEKGKYRNPLKYSRVDVEWNTDSPIGDLPISRGGTRPIVSQERSIQRAREERIAAYNGSEDSPREPLGFSDVHLKEKQMKTF